MNSILVYSCVTGGYDAVQSTILASDATPEPGVRYVLYTDQLPPGLPPSGIRPRVFA